MNESARLDISPYDLVPESALVRADVAALCLHGLTGTPYEVRPLAEALVERGIRAKAPLLPGHNTSPEQLATFGHASWCEAVHEEYRSLDRQHERVFVVGLSMGGLLALDLSADERVDGLVVVGTPLVFRQPIPLLIPLLKWIMPMRSKKGGPDIRDPAARERHPGYDLMPLAAVHELIRLQRRVRGRLARISAPVFVAHGSHDSTANPEDARVIHREVRSASKRVEFYSESAHVVPVDFDGAKLALAVADFLGGLAAEGAK